MPAFTKPANSQQSTLDTKQNILFLLNKSHTSLLSRSAWGSSPVQHSELQLKKKPRRGQYGVTKRKAAYFVSEGFETPTQNQ